ncbi:MAG: 4-(cytidine 5'-diphospho)-2-C-methyl-D-erythritol kinase [Olsenella sp.]|nr:4-(cytidine 5'-diphospho)-2-C-methyl-D-erythritol kinase [Olsenella sp.]
MQSTNTTDFITLRAPVKVNLHLGIYPGRDERGYHRADSVMIALALGDTVTVRALPRIAPEASEAERTGGVLLEMSEDVGVDYRKNTAWIAASHLRTALAPGVSPADAPIAISVEKGVLPQSGLGGSSSDAASVILALCRMWNVSPRDERVVAVARSVGADVPFFLNPSPSYLSGAGDVLEETLPEMNDVPVVLVRPREGVSTVAAYRAFDEAPTTPPPADAMRAALRTGDVSGVARHLYNNLGPVAERLVSDDARIVEWLTNQCGVLGAQVSGSGSCVFALCDTAAHAGELALLAQELGWWSAATHTMGANDLADASVLSGMR